MKYGIAIVWDGPYDDKVKDEAHALCLCDCFAIKAREINKSMRATGLPDVDYWIVMRTEDDLPKDAGAAPEKK